MSGDQVVFQTRASNESGKSRVFVRNREDTEGSTLASVYAKDFRLGTDGDGLIGAFTRIQDLDRKCDRTFTAISKEGKAAHRRMDQTFPSIDARLSILEDTQAKLIKKIEDTSQGIASVMDSVRRNQDELAIIRSKTESTGQAYLDIVASVESAIKRIGDELGELKKFNEKVVLFYGDDEVV